MSPRGRPKLKRQSPPGPPSSPAKALPAEVLPSIPPRRLGLRSASNRAKEWAAGADHLPAHKLALLDVSARLLIHLLNISNRLYYLGELRQDGEPRATIKTMLDLNEKVVAGLASAFPEGRSNGDDPLGGIFDGGNGHDRS